MSSGLVWCIGGIDSSQGAGITTDVTTLNLLGVNSMVVTTMVTAQHDGALEAVEVMSAAMIESQLCALWHQYGTPSAIKIGALANRGQLEAIARWCKQHIARPWPLNCEVNQPFVDDTHTAVVVDPVLFSSSHGQLSELTQLEDWAPLLPFITLFTPNYAEFTQLFGVAEPLTSARLKAAAQAVRSWLLVTGGDVEGSVSQDWLVNPTALWPLSSPKLPHNPRGTGCALSSAICGFIALRYGLQDAVLLAKSHLYQRIEAATGFNDGLPPRLAQISWPHKHCGKSVRISQNLPLGNRLDFAKVSSPIGLYGVVDSCDWLLHLAKLGVGTLQLRIKQLNEQSEQEIERAIAIGRDYGVEVYINDHWQLAIKHGAYGVHLGQEDLQQANLTAIAEAGLRLGVSSHGPWEYQLATQLKPSYIAIGHLFPTVTKSMPSAPQGVTKLRHMVQMHTDECPLVAIGGIDEHTIGDVVAAGCRSVAMVRALKVDKGLTGRLTRFNNMLEGEHVNG